MPAPTVGRRNAASVTSRSVIATMYRRSLSVTIVQPTSPSGVRSSGWHRLALPAASPSQKLGADLP